MATAASPVALPTATPSGEAPGPPQPALEPGDVRVTYLPQAVREEIREELRKDVMTQARAEGWALPGAVPPWLERISLNAEMLLRLQADLFQRGNSTQWLNYQAINAAGSLNIPNASLYTNPSDPSAAADNRQRLQVRTRLGLQGRISEEFSAGLRLTTGNTSQPVVTVQTLGNTANRYSVVLDHAYLKFSPSPWLELARGRIPNPWFGSDLVWGPDLAFEGVAGTLRRPGKHALALWLGAGAFPLQELGSASRDKWLYGTQAGLDWDLGRGLSGRLGLAYYQYTHLTGVANPASGDFNVNDYTAPQYLQKGNTVFNIADTMLHADAALYALAADPLHVTVLGDYVRNVGYHPAEVLARSGLSLAPRVSGYHLRLSFGAAELANRRDWQVQLGYRHLERDAVLDEFTDPDFHLGGTDTGG